MPNISYHPYATAANTIGAGGRPRKGGRRPKEIEETVMLQLDSDELEKRRVRRIRNKEAAARCRQRRMDQLEELQKQVAILEGDLSLKDDEIEDLQAENNRLLALMKGQNISIPRTINRKQEQQQQKPIIVNKSRAIQQLQSRQQPKISSQPPQPQMAVRFIQPVYSESKVLDSGYTTAQAPGPSDEPTLNQVAAGAEVIAVPSLPIMNAKDISDSLLPSRPSSLNFGANKCLPSRNYNKQSINNVSIETPSNGFGPANTSSGFDLMGIPTGLTPLSSYPMSNVLTPLVNNLMTPTTQAVLCALETPTSTAAVLQQL